MGAGFLSDGRTSRHNEAVVTFRSFANAPQNSLILPTYCVYGFLIDLRTSVVSLNGISCAVAVMVIMCSVCGRNWILGCNLGQFQSKAVP